MTEVVHQPVEGQPPRPAENPPTVSDRLGSDRLGAERRQQVVNQVAALYEATPDWATFFREVLGASGIVRRMYPAPEQLELFEKSEEYTQIQQMLAKLRERSKNPNDSKEPMRVITVRLPKCVHESLRNEAHLKKTSMNQLCISKLLQMIDDELVPAD
jgi:predicted HicB family RNase H-like nuclease